jgi:hypothetical protein
MNHPAASLVPFAALRPYNDRIPAAPDFAPFLPYDFSPLLR